MSVPHEAVRVAAHRGGAALWPENSLGAFRQSVALGVDLLELDVHLTRDGEIVVIHDPTLERTTTGRGVVRDHSWKELAGVAVHGTAGEPIPRLREVLDLIGSSDAGLLVEIKSNVGGIRYRGIEEKVLGLVEERDLLGRATVMAFEWDLLERLRALSPVIRLAGLLDRAGARRLGGTAVAIERLTMLKANGLGIERTLLTGEAVEAVRRAGLTIGVWTVNEPEEVRRALALGVDDITTDRPDVALALRKEMR